MGISNQPTPSAYVPPRTVKSTLLGESEAAQSDDLNRSPATTVELRFRKVSLPTNLPPWSRVGTSRDHAFIVITDNTTGEQWVNEAGPHKMSGAPAQKLKSFTDQFNQSRVSYQLPSDVLPMIPSFMQDYFPTRNSNHYGGYAWEHLTGSVPKLPAGFDAPGSGDHARDPYGAIP